MWNLGVTNFINYSLLNLTIMKKVTLLIPLFIIFFSSSCNQGSKSPTSIAPKIASGAQFLESLNGIDTLTSARYIQNFNEDQDNDDSPRRTSVWLSKEELNDIYNLLRGEIAVERQRRRGRFLGS